MTRIRTIDPAGFVPGRGYAHGMAGQGELLAIAGQIGWDGQQRFVSDDFIDQFGQALANVVAVVNAAGGDAADIISLTIYVVDKQVYLARAKELGPIWRSRMGRHYPAMALVQVVALVEDRAQVEIQGLALLPDRGSSPAPGS